MSGVDKTRDELFAEYFEDREGSAKVAEHAYRQGWKDRATYTVVPIAPTQGADARPVAIPEGWRMRNDGDAVVVQKEGLGGVVAHADGESIASTILHQLVIDLLATRDAEASDAPESVGLPPYPSGQVVGPCVCGSWPGGACLKCKVIPARDAAPSDAVVWQETDEEGTPLWGENTFAANEGTFEHERALSCIAASAPMEKT